MMFCTGVFNDAIRILTCVFQTNPCTPVPLGIEVTYSLDETDNIIIHPISHLVIPRVAIRYLNPWPHNDTFFRLRTS